MNLRSVSAATPSRDDVAPCTHPVPLAELERDLGGAPVDGWELHLGKQGIPIVPDDLGRSSVSRQHARMLLDAHRAEQLRKQRFAAQQEAEAVEASRRFFASLPKPLSASAIPDGAAYGDLVRQAAKDAQPRRRSMLEESLSGKTMVYHEIPRGESE